jgi:hypothetical protein
MLRIEKALDGKKMIFRVSGRLSARHVEELKAETAGEGVGTAMDLQYVTGVDLEGVRFLSESERAGIELFHCSHYIREWINRERRRIE